MTLIQRHILLPSIAPLLFFAVAVTPVQVLGCRTRGLLALAIAFISVLGALGLAFRALKGRMQGDPDTKWWIISSVILAIPAIGMLLLA
jgi:hypothetical protein